MKNIYLTLIFIFLVFPGKSFSAEVAQGKCLETTDTSVTLEEFDTNFSTERYGNPTDIISTFDTTSAKIGIHPEKGDILRIAYRVQNDKKIAYKVMNVSKQDLRKK